MGAPDFTLGASFFPGYFLTCSVRDHGTTYLIVLSAFVGLSHLCIPQSFLCSFYVHLVIPYRHIDKYRLFVPSASSRVRCYPVYVCHLHNSLSGRVMTTDRTTFCPGPLSLTIRTTRHWHTSSPILLLLTNQFMFLQTVSFIFHYYACSTDWFPYWVISHVLSVFHMTSTAPSPVPVISPDACCRLRWDDVWSGTLRTTYPTTEHGQETNNKNDEQSYDE